MPEPLLLGAAVQPGVQHADRIVQPVRSAERDESSAASDRAGGRQPRERGDGELGLRQRQPGIGTEPGKPARSGRFEPPRLLVERQQEERQGVGERDFGELPRHAPREEEIPSGEGALELAVGAPFRGHERMFAWFGRGTRRISD